MQNAEFTTIRMQVYEKLKNDISTGVYPSGARLREQELSERYQISRSPIREALHQLAAEGLITEVPNKGAFVREMTAAEMVELFDARVLLESYAIRNIRPEKLAAHHDNLIALLTVSEEAYADRDLSLFIAIDKKLHSEIVSMCDNRLINEFYERISARSSRFRSYALSTEGRWMATVDEHRTTVMALLNGDCETAVQRNTIHLERARAAVLELLSK